MILLERPITFALMGSMTPAQGTGSRTREIIMTLTYRGQKYQQNKEAVEPKHPQLQYRGLIYKK